MIHRARHDRFQAKLGKTEIAGTVAAGRGDGAI